MASAEKLKFDKQAFLELIDNDKELFTSLLSLFCEDWPHLVNKLDRAVGKGQLKTIEQVGHRLKGNLRNFYAEDVALLAAEIEGSARDHDLSDIESKILQLRTQLKELEGELTVFHKNFVAKK